VLNGDRVYDLRVGDPQTTLWLATDVFAGRFASQTSLTIFRQQLRSARQGMAERLVLTRDDPVRRRCRQAFWRLPDATHSVSTTPA
jgi:hypothetical protein